MTRTLGVAAVGLVALAMAAPAVALDPDRGISRYVRSAWGAERGFVGGTVHALAQTADGYLWIGTERGLIRFDGATFEVIADASAAPLSLERSLRTSWASR